MCGENNNLVAATYEKSLTKSSKLKAAKENVTGANQAFTGQYFLLDKNKDSKLAHVVAHLTESHTSEGFRNTLIQRERVSSSKTRR